MARPLKGFNTDTVNEYETKMEIADLEGDKKKLKELKRLFKSYIEKQKMTLDDFNEHPIRQYFSNTGKPKTNQEYLIQKRHYMKARRKHSYIVNKVKENYGNEDAKVIKNYLVKLWKINNIKMKYKMGDFIKKVKDDFVAYYFERMGIDQVDERYIKIIELYETEYKNNILNRYKNTDRKQLYIIKRAKEDYGEDTTDWINSFYNNEISATDDDAIEDIYFYGIEYDNRFRNIKDKQFFVIDRINEFFGDDYTDVMLDYYNKELKADNIFLEKLNELVSLLEKEYGKRTGKTKQKAGRPKKTKR